MGTEGQEFAYTEDKQSMFTPRVINDECSELSNEWKTTTLKFTSRKFIRLPITDFAPIATEDNKAMFGVELGPVCFM